MFAFAAGREPVLKVSAVLARVAAAAVLATLGGCASARSASTAQYAGANMRVAQAVTEVEADGLPAQTPPSPRAHQVPDDPNEPFSKNYGGVNPSASAAPLSEPVVPQHAPAPKIPSDLPPVFRQKLVAALAENE